METGPTCRIREEQSAMKKTGMNRRQFLNGSLAAGVGASFAIGGTKSSGRVIGANETIRVAIAGLNGRGASHVSSCCEIPGVEIAYLVDPDTRVYPKRLDQIKMKDGSAAAPKTIQDVRRALDDKDVDVLSVATPNHWHSLMTLWGCQAGKDVYVEKPCSHNIREGRIAVEAARKYNRIVQHGTQSRSDTDWALTAEVIRSGKLGKLQVSRALCYKNRKSIGVKPNIQIPSEIDYSLWLGPATEHGFNENYVHYNWHWFWDFGNGDIGNQGVHQMDIARWMIPDSSSPSGSATFPKSVFSLGGRFGYEDQGETPNTQISVMDFGPTQLIFEVRGLPSKPFMGEGIGNIAHLEAGTIVGGKTFTPKGKTEAIPLAKLGIKSEDDAPRGPGKNHYENFIAAVRSRKVDDLNADILEGHYSSALCHLANISYRLSEPVPFNAKSKAFGDCKEACETLDRMEEHLGKEHGLKLDAMTYNLGRKLNFNGATESFVDAPGADKLLTRPYRAPFIVPDKL
jgi:predicted dehydrogenase